MLFLPDFCLLFCWFLLLFFSFASISYVSHKYERKWENVFLLALGDKNSCEQIYFFLRFLFLQTFNRLRILNKTVSKRLLSYHSLILSLRQIFKLLWENKNKNAGKRRIPGSGSRKELSNLWGPRPSPSHPPTTPPNPLPAIQTLFQVIFLRHTHKQTERIDQGICKIRRRQTKIQTLLKAFA